MISLKQPRIFSTPNLYLFFQIIHLKRFNFVNNKWVKSQKVVNFPFKNFDPTPYLASVPQETILRHKELSEQHNGMNGSVNVTDKKCNMEIDDEIGEFDRENFIGSIDENEIAEEAMVLDEVDGRDDEQIESSLGNNVNKMSTRYSANNSTKRMPNRSIAGRQRLVSSSLTQTPVIDGHLVDYHNHKLKDGQDPYDLKYQLYAVVVSIIESITCPITYSKKRCGHRFSYSSQLCCCGKASSPKNNT